MVYLLEKRAVNLCISHYQYSGDVQRMGQLGMLDSKLPQDRNMSQAFKDTIAAEIDTQNRALRLMQILEVCIQFIISVGSSSTKNFDGRTTLASYVLNTLHIPQQEWDEISTPTIQQQICLRNIQALYLLLETLVNGNPLEDVLPGFCENLPQELEAVLRSACAKMNRGDLAIDMRDFMLAQLTKYDTCKPDMDLKETLGFFNDLQYEPWWKEFPEGLTMAHFKEAYLIVEASA